MFFFFTLLWPIPLSSWKSKMTCHQNRWEFYNNLYFNVKKEHDIERLWKEKWTKLTFTSSLFPSTDSTSMVSSFILRMVEKAALSWLSAILITEQTDGRRFIWDELWMFWFTTATESNNCKRKRIRNHIWDGVNFIEMIHSVEPNGALFKRSHEINYHNQEDSHPKADMKNTTIFFWQCL